LAHKLVDLIVGRVCKYIVTVIVNQEFFLLLLRERDSLSKFPISLTIELICLNKDSTTCLSSLEKDEVSWDALILYNFDNHAYSYVLGGDWFDGSQTCLLALQHSKLCIVQFFVSTEAIKVIHSFLEHCHDKYECKWSDISEEESNLEERYKLTDCDDQEEHVEEELEFVVEYFEDERENVVLLIIQAI